MQFHDGLLQTIEAFIASGVHEPGRVTDFICKLEARLQEPIHTDDMRRNYQSMLDRLRTL